MENSDLYALLKTLNNHELSELDVFIQKETVYGKGRYREQVALLYKYLRPLLADADAMPADKQALFRVIFPEQKVSETQVERVIHELLRLVRQFLLLFHYLSDENEQRRQLDYVSIIADKGMEPKALVHLNQLQKELDAETSKGLKHYQLNTEACWKRYELHSHSPNWKSDLAIPEVLKALDLYYYSRRYLLVNHYWLFNRFSKMKNTVLPEPIRANMNIHEGYLKNEPLLFLHYKIHILISNDVYSKAAYDELLTHITQHEPALDREATNIIYSFLRNYLIFLIRDGRNDLLHYAHQLNLACLEKGYLFYDGKLAPGVYSNLANTAIRANEAEWALWFMDAHKDKCLGPAEDTELTYHLHMAMYYHRKKDYTTALRQLPQSSNNLVRVVAIKVLEIMCYYDMGDELFQYKLDAFKMYVKRGAKNLLSAHVSVFYNNFINILLQISHTAPHDHERAHKIMQRIKSKGPIAERDWLMQKVEELLR
jgi:hypothetical protein